MLVFQRNQLAAFAFASAMGGVVLPIACGGGNDNKTIATTQSTVGNGGATSNSSSKGGETTFSGLMIASSSVGGDMSTTTATSQGGTSTSSPASTAAEGGTGKVQYEWDVNYGGGNQNDQATAFDVAIDKSGNIIVVGAYQGQVDFDGPGGLAPSNSVGGDDIFVAKYNNKGVLIWRKVFGDGNTQSATSVTVDSNNRIGICGIFKGTINLGGNNLSFSGFQYPDLYAAVLDPDGNHVASNKYGDGITDSDFCYAAAFDTAGNLLITGQYQSKISFGGTVLTASGGAGDFDMYLAKLQPNVGTKSFDTLMAKSYGSSGSDSLGRALATAANGDIALGGWTRGSINFGKGVLNPKITPTPAQPVFARLDGAGNEKYAKMLFAGAGEMDDSEVHAVAFQPNGDLYVGGVFKGSVDLGAGPLKAVGGSNDVFVARFEGTTGNPVFGVRLGDQQGDELNDMALDTAGFPVFAGSFQGSVKVNSTTTLVGKGIRDGDVIKLANTDGHGYWGSGFGDAQLQESTGIAVNAAGSSIFVGNFRGSMDLGGGIRTAPNGSQAFFIGSFGP